MNDRPGGEFDFGSALRLVESLFDAVCAPDRWRELLGVMIEYLGADMAVAAITAAEPAGLLGSYQVGVTRDFSDPWLAACERTFKARNPAMTIPSTVGDFSVYRDLAPAGPEGITSDFVLRLQIERKRFVFAFLRGGARGRWSDDDFGRLGTVLPHFWCAVRLASRLACESVVEAALGELARSRPAPFLLTDRARRIHFANPAADTLLDAGTAIARQPGGFTFADARARHAFERLFDIADGGGPEPVRGTLDVPMAGGGRNLRGEVVMLEESRHRAGGRPNGEDHRRALFVLRDPWAMPEPDRRELQSAFGLTATEADIMAASAKGFSAPEIATMTHRSHETVRSHIKSIFQKTGTRSQADIVRLVCNLCR